MSDQSATPAGGRIFEPMPTLELEPTIAASPMSLPSDFAGQLQPSVREGDVGTFQGWPIVRILGQGAMGLVLHGYDQRLRRDVAIKMIHPDRLDDSQMALRFAREARLTAQVNHPHVITVYSVHDDANRAYIVMEYLHGGTLQVHLGDHTILEEECIRIARDIAEGLQAAHEVGLLHRDLKPSNIGFRQPGGHVVIMDFGLARTLCDTDPLTVHGSPLGTPAFMSPEQIQVQKLDHRTDLFSLGTVMYLMVTGQLPFQGCSPAVLCHAICSSTHPSVRSHAPDVSRGLESIIHRLLQKSPSQRFQNATQLIEALDRLSEPASTRSRHRLMAGGLSAALLAAVGAFEAARFIHSGGDSPALSVAVSSSDAAEASSPVPTAVDPASPPDEAGVTTPAPTDPVPEFRDAAGVVWHSTNQEHAGHVSVDADGVVRLENSADGADSWAMVEGTLADLPTSGRYLSFDIVELATGGNAVWAAKLASPDDPHRDIELNYSHETGRFAFLLPEPFRTTGSEIPVRLFIVGPDGAFVRFRDVRIADAVPEGVRELPVLPTH